MFGAENARPVVEVGPAIFQPAAAPKAAPRRSDLALAATRLPESARHDLGGLTVAERTELQAPDRRGGARPKRPAVKVGVSRDLPAPIGFSGLPSTLAAGGSVPVSGGLLERSVDGSLVWTASFSSAGAGALRLYIRQARLPAGSRVYVYGEDGEVQGPYNFSPGIRPGRLLDQHDLFGPDLSRGAASGPGDAVGNRQSDAPRRRRRAPRAPGLRTSGGSEGLRRPPEVRRLLHRPQLRDDRRVSERGQGHEGRRAAHVRGRGLVLRLHGRPDEHDDRELRALSPDGEPLLFVAGFGHLARGLLAVPDRDLQRPLSGREPLSAHARLDAARDGRVAVE